jgi:hypothetical protein
VASASRGFSNTSEVLYLLNRPGNAVSHQDCAGWIDRAIEVVEPHAGQITLRGDTDFSLTGELDRWDEMGTKFIFGMDAHPKVVELAEGLEKGAWKPLERLPRYEILTRARRKSERVKESIVRFKGYQNKVLTGESVAQIDYQPNKCKKAYRLVIVRKNISVQKGEQVLFDDLRYFFYITNHCGVNAMRMPVDDLLSNWAYMVMTSLAWNLKAWFGLLLPDTGRGRQVLRMEFRRFLHAFILIPAQIPNNGLQCLAQRSLRRMGTPAMSTLYVAISPSHTANIYIKASARGELCPEICQIAFLGFLYHNFPLQECLVNQYVRKNQIHDANYFQKFFPGSSNFPNFLTRLF